MLLPTLLLACGMPADLPVERPPPQSEGTVLWVGDRSLLVGHEGTKDRTKPGVEHYPTSDDPSGVKLGSLLDLWVDRDDHGWGTITHWEAREIPGLPEGFDAKGHPLKGVVVRVDGARVTVDHEEVPDVMMAMVMPFDVLPAEASAVRPSDRIEGTLLDTPHGFRLVAVKKVGKGDAALRRDVKAIDNGDPFPPMEVPIQDGSSMTIGAGQEKATALTYLYTTCPDPNFCPAISARMAALQEAVGTDARILTITIDPRIDSFPILKRYGRGMGSNPEIWSFGRLEPVHLQRAAMLSGMSVTERGGKIEHLIRLLILDGEGKLVERYDDNEWDLDRVVSQLRTGEPKGPAKTGTLKGKPE